MPLSRGLFGFVALRCYAEECAFSLSTQVQDHVWDLVKYKRVEPAHCPTGATTGGTGCERFFVWPYRPPCLRTRNVLFMAGMLELERELYPSNARDKVSAPKMERITYPKSLALASCPSGCRAGWAVRRFSSLVLNDVLGVVLCFCAQGEGAFHHIARYEALLAPRIGAQPFRAKRSFTTRGSGNHLRQYKVCLPLVRPLGTFHQQHSPTPRHRFGMANT